ncbi:MAG: ribosome silencing factor [Candidatus Omnitrophica bacterium]|nr:ribosome silencing factor [Candidatus Omnitrophota bacterium]
MPDLRDRDVQDIRKISSLLLLIKQSADDKKAQEIIALDLRKASNLCDYFFICSAGSTRQAKAIADGIIESLKKKKVRPWHIEGYNEGRWVLLDYNTVVVHILHNEARSFYKLERLWGDAPHVTFPKTKKQTRCARTTVSKKKSPA